LAVSAWWCSSGRYELREWDELRRRSVDWIDLEVVFVFVFAAQSAHVNTRLCRRNRRALSKLACVW
jgi:hypothetical protein